MVHELNSKDNQLRVKSFEPNLVQIEIINFRKWKEENSTDSIKIGSILKIEDGVNNNILCIVKSFKMVEKFKNEEEQEPDEYDGSFIIDTQPVGRLQEDEFRKGINDISIPPNGVSVASDEELKKIFSVGGCESPFTFANHNLKNEIPIIANGDRLFSKHLAVVGSTGSGKSCSVATVIQSLEVERDDNQNNTHVLIFDIHGEYKNAFPDSNHLSIEDGSLKLPYWLLNSEELEDLFIEVIK